MSVDRAKRLYILVELKYENKIYAFIDDHSNYKYEGYDIKCGYWWEEGNGSCDCNRSLEIIRHCDNSFPEMECGDNIKLLNLTFIGDWREDDEC